MIDPSTIQPYDVKKYQQSLVSWLGNIAGQIKSIEQSQERIKQREALFAEDKEDFCPICGDPNQNGLGFCCAGHRDLHYSEHEPNLHQEDEPSNPDEFYDIDEGMGIKE